MWLPRIVILFACWPLLGPVTGADEPRYRGMPASHWIKRLDSMDVRTRRIALKALGELGQGAKAALPALLRGLQYADEGIRLDSIQALGAVGPDARVALPLLLETLRDRDRNFRLAAVQALAALRPQTAEVVPALLEIFRDESHPELRVMACKVFAAMGPLARQAVPELVKTLVRPPTPDVEKAVVQALQHIGAPAAPALLQALRGKFDIGRLRAAKALVTLGPAAVPGLVEALRDENALTREYAGRILAALGAKAKPAIAALAEALRDDAVTTAEAAYALNERVPFLGGEIGVRVAAALALERMGPEVAAFVRPLLKDGNAKVREAAARILARTEPRRDAEPVPPAKPDRPPPPPRGKTRYKGRTAEDWAKDLESPMPQVRDQAIDALDILGPAAEVALPQLVPLLKQHDRILQIKVLRTLGKIGPGARAAAPAMFELLLSKDLWLRYDAIRALLEIRPQGKEAAAALTAALQDANRLAAQLLKDRAQGYLREKPNNLFRQGVARALASLGADAKAAIPALVELLQSGNPEVGYPAAEALGQIGGEAINALENALGSSDRRRRMVALQGLKRGGSASVPALVKAMKDGDNSIRVNAALALADIGPAAVAAVPALTAALRDSKGYAATYADALAKIGPDSVPFLAGVLETAPLQEREKAARALRQLGKHARPALPALVDALRDNTSAELIHNLSAILKDIGADAAPFLADALRTSSEHTYHLLCNTLLELGPAARVAVPVLIEALDDQEIPGGRPGAGRPIARTGKRYHAARVLTALGAEAVPDLVAALQVKGRRLGALRVLAELGPRAGEAVPILSEALGKPEQDRHRRSLAALALLSVVPRVAALALLPLQEAPDLQWRLEVAAALQKLGPEAHAAVPALIETLTRPHPELRRLAAQALHAIGPKAKAAVPALKAALLDEHPAVRAAATEALLRIRLGP